MFNRHGGQLEFSASEDGNGIPKASAFVGLILSLSSGFEWETQSQIKR